MLTITAPIELKCRIPAAPNEESFFHRITDNYTMLTQKLTPEDLLHVVTTPPEYYFGGEEQMNVFQQTNISSAQQNKLEIVNNLINRILVAPSAELTYQDKVYITDTLQKLGIRNVNEFMHQVTRVTQELQQTETLIDLYWAHVSELQQLVENYQSTQTTEQHRHEQSEQTERLYLHEEVMNRLQTGAIYQILQSFHAQTQGEQNISWSELQLSEQYRLSQNLLLQKLKSEAHGEPQPLTFYHENHYESMELHEDTVNEDTMIRQMNAAVLLNLIDQVYNSRSRQIRSGDLQWYHMERSFYQNAQNTFKRFEYHVNAGADPATERTELYLTQQSTAEQREIELLQQLFVDTDSVQYQTVQKLLNRQDTVQQAGEHTYLNEQQELTYQTMQELTEQQEQHYETTEQTLREEELSLVEQEISRINRENINQQSRYMQMMQNIELALESPAERKSAETQRQESLLALEHPDELLQQLREEGQAHTAQREQQLAQAMKLLPEETRVVYETVREYLAAPMELRRQMDGVSSDVGMLVRDIQNAELIHEQHTETEERIERTQERITTFTDRLMEQAPVKPQQQTITDRQRTDVTLVHRSTEQQLDEELIGELLEQNRKLSQTVHQTTEQQTNYQHTDRSVTNIETNRIAQQNEHVNELVRQGMQKELGVLSDRIYRKLEKRLEAEKRRRGY